EPTLGGSEGDDDEDHLEAFEKDALEGDGERVPVEAATLLDARRGGALAFLAKRFLLVVQRLVAARPQDRLAKPLEAEDEQQRPDDEPQSVDGDPTERGTEGRDQASQHDPRRRDADQRRAPAAHHSDAEDD